jgi:hypothetical protein
MTEHDYDIDAILGEKQRPGKSRKLLALAVAAVVLVLALLARLILAGPAPTTYEDQTVTAGMVGTFTSLEDVGGEWMAVAAPDWAGAANPSIARDECPRLARSIGVEAGELLNILSPSGLQLTACEPAR